MGFSGQKRPARTREPESSDQGAADVNRLLVLGEDAPDTRPSAREPRAEQPRLLVMDDEPGICRFVSKAAESLGFDVLALSDPQAFLSTLSDFRPHLLLLDLKMPHTDGIELLRAAGGACAQTRVVVMSGMDHRVLKGAEDFGRASGLDIWGVLRKPVRLEELKRCLTQAVEPGAAITVDELQDALAAGELVLHYQPKVTRAGKHWAVQSVEALVRWQHRHYGTLLPGQFLPLAQRSGCMDALTDQVLAAALDQVADWSARGVDFNVAVNLPATTFQDAHFPQRFKQLLERHGVEGTNLTLEVTESAAMANAELAKQVCLQLRLTGAGLSIDDFGTGYSSLRQLYDLPFNELKVDRAFTVSLPHDDEARAIVTATVGLAHALGMTTCAEGVETAEALEYVGAIGCDSAQGFFVSRALPAEAVADFARTWNEAAPRAARRGGA